MADFKKYGILPEKGRKYENIIYVLALIYEKYMHLVSAYLAKFDLSPAKFNVLMVVCFQGGTDGIKQVAIGEKLIVSAGNITGLIEKLVKEGLVTRQTSPHSRRENSIKITAKGKTLIEKIWPGYDALVKQMTDLIPAKEQTHISKVFETWFLGMDKINPKA